MHILHFLAALPTVYSAILAPRNNTLACNNSPGLCNKAYSDITHLGAHDSPFLRDASTSYSTSGNQAYDSPTQLDAGVRLLTAQVHNNNGAWHLCHSSCALLDAGPLSTWLGDIKTWMDKNPNDVVTILLVNSDDASAQQLAPEFSASGIQKYAYTPISTTSPPSQWPTLQSMISQNQRLVTFVASLSAASNTVAPYLLDEFVFLFENPFEVTSLSNFTCTPSRPSAVSGDSKAAISSGRLPLMNHFLDMDSGLGIKTPDVGNITITNAPGNAVGNLGKSASDCQQIYGQKPTFVLVDFFDQGPAIETVDKLNGVTNAVGRKAVTAAKMQATNAAGRGIGSTRASWTILGLGCVLQTVNSIL